MKLTEFRGDTVVLGRERTVAFAHVCGVGKLTFEGVTYEEAMELVHRVADKTQPVAVAVEAKGASVRSTQQVKPEKGLKKLEPPKSRPLPQVQETGTGAPKSTPASRPTPVPYPAQADEVVFPPDREPSRAEVALAVTLAGAPEPGVDGALGCPEKVVKSGRFIDVLEWVMKTRGLKAEQVDEIVAVIEQLKELPAVRRVRDIKDRVISNLAAYEEAGSGA